MDFSLVRGRARALLAVAGLITAPAVALWLLPGTASGPAAATKKRPNIVVVMSDDQHVRALRTMPNVRSLIGAKGVTFSNSFVNYSLCCPSRTTYLTGQYAHNHQVLFNLLPSGGYAKLRGFTDPKLAEANTLPVWLSDAGYHTNHIGKYLNGYGNPGRGTATATVPPGWQEWHGSVDPSTYRMYGYTLLEDGKLNTYGNRATGEGYQTDVYTDKAVRYIGERAPSNQPFFLSIAYLAPHSEAAGRRSLRPNPEPAKRHQGDLAGVAPPKPPSYDEPDVSDKPAYVQRRPRLTPPVQARITRNHQARLESLLAVDEGVARIMGALRAAGELENTVVVFTADNGFMHGEHRIPSGKVVPYEESVRVPLLIRGPGVDRGAQARELVSNVDLAATIVDAAGARARRTLDGRSLWPLLRRPGTSWDRDLLVATGPQTNIQWYQAVRTERHMYVEHSTGERELYDLRRDPYQLVSRHADRAYASVRRKLQRRLAALKSCRGRACRGG